jgi:membrane protein YdbS with pleckstrin-like domain
VQEAAGEGGDGQQRQPTAQTAGSNQQQSRQQLQQLDPDVWATKPAWCQPVTILATGGALVGGVWALSSGSPWWTGAAAVPIVAWWFLFLAIMPAQYREYAESVNAELQQQQQQRRD